jgi:mono/diheme cytochrome c family protein
MGSVSNYINRIFTRTAKAPGVWIFARKFYKTGKGCKMKIKLIFSLTLLALIITSCGGQSTQTSSAPVAPTREESQPTPVPASADVATKASAAGVSFSNNVMPIFTNSCNECHGGKQTKAGLDLRTYDSLMAGSKNGVVVLAGNSADSLLVQLVTKGKMPKRGPKLTPEQIKIISDWITAGASNN